MDNLLQYIAAPILVFIGGYILLRIAGKKAVSEMNSFDMVFVIVLGHIISEPLLSKQVFETTYFAIAFVILYMALARLSLNNKLRWFFVASPTVLVRGGDIDEQGLRKVKMTTGELLGKLRQKGYTKTADVELAIMEDVGKISVIPKSNARALQPSDIQLQPSPTYVPIPVIMNGEILDHNLKYLNKDYDWLESQLQAWQIVIDDISDVTLATINQQGAIEVDTDKPTEHDKGIYNYKPGNQN